MMPMNKTEKRSLWLSIAFLTGVLATLGIVLWQLWPKTSWGGAVIDYDLAEDRVAHTATSLTVIGPGQEGLRMTEQTYEIGPEAMIVLHCDSDTNVSPTWQCLVGPLLKVTLVTAGGEQTIEQVNKVVIVSDQAAE